MPKVPVDFSKMLFFELSNGTDKYINYTTDIYRRKYKIKCRVKDGDKSAVYEAIRSSTNGFDDWTLTIIEQFPGAICIEEILKRKKQLIEERNANLNAGETRYCNKAYKRSWYLKKKMNQTTVYQEVAEELSIITDKDNLTLCHQNLNQNTKEVF